MQSEWNSHNICTLPHLIVVCKHVSMHWLMASSFALTTAAILVSGLILLYMSLYESVGSLGHPQSSTAISAIVFTILQVTPEKAEF